MKRSTLRWLRKELRKELRAWSSLYDRLGLQDSYPEDSLEDRCSFGASMYSIRRDQYRVVCSLLRGEVDWKAFRRATTRRGWKW